MTIQNTNTSLLNDKMVDMAFITTFSGLSDKCFYKLIKDDAFPNRVSLIIVPAGCKVRLRTGYKIVLINPDSKLITVITNS